jgi:hypothetical protein
MVSAGQNAIASALPAGSQRAGALSAAGFANIW